MSTIRTLTVVGKDRNEAVMESIRAAEKNGIATSRLGEPMKTTTFVAKAPAYKLWRVPVAPLQHSEWNDILPVLTGVLANPEAPARAKFQVHGNLALMAELADRYLNLVERGSGDLTGLTPQLDDPDKETVTQ